MPKVSAPQGTWVALPSGSDCTPPTTSPRASLLGWATRPDFPLDIAKRQIDNGWCAYEIYTPDGVLAAVFIPAGKFTLLSSEGNLYPIWSE